MEPSSVIGNFDAGMVNALIGRARNLTAFGERYAAAPAVSVPNDLSLLPILTRDDLASAFEELAVAARATDRPGYVFASGGTTAKPRQSIVPAHLLGRPVSPEWRPFDNDDVAVNLFDAGRGWSVHYLTNAVIEGCGATAVAYGRLEPDDFDTQFDIWRELGVTAIAGTPTTAEALLHHGLRRGEVPFRKVLWAGEPWTDAGRRALRSAPNKIETWSIYGATESWVVATNGPACDLSVFHPIDGIIVDLYDDPTAVVTSWANNLGLVLRYDMGDRMSIGPCGCGRPGLVLGGRTDHKIKIFGSLFEPDAILSVARACPGVEQAQLHVERLSNGRESVDLRIVAVPDAAVDPADVLAAVRRGFHELDTLIGRTSESFHVTPVASLQVDARTGKTPSVVRGEPRSDG